MRDGWRVVVIALVLSAGLVAAARVPGETALAQSEPGTCEMVYVQAIASLLDHCTEAVSGSICWASGAVSIETTSGPLVGGPGSTVPYGVVTGVSIADEADEWGIAQIRMADPANYLQYTTLLLVGPLTLTMDEESAMPRGSAFTLTTESDPAPCGELARPAVLVQAPDKSLALLRVNGVDMAINGTAALHAADAESLTVSAIARETILGQTGTVIFAGFGATVTPGETPDVAPYDSASMAHLPTETLPRLEIVPVPGNAFVNQEINLYLRPAAEAFTGTTLQAGLPVNILGQSTDRAWLYVRTYNGTLAWVPRAALDVTMPEEPPSYDEAPPPPSRPFGPLQAQGVTTTEYNNLRAGPGTQYEIVTHLLLHVPVDVYARSPDNEWLLVETEEGIRAWLNLRLFGATTDFNLDQMPYSPEFPLE